MPPQFQNNIPSTDNPANTHPKNKFPKWAKYVLGICTVFIIFLAVMYVVKYYKVAQQNIDAQESEGLLAWKTYTNNQYGFEVKYPNNWSVQQKGYGDMGGFYYIGFYPVGKSDASIAIRIYPNQSDLNNFTRYFEYVGQPKSMVLSSVNGMKFNPPNSLENDPGVIALVKNGFGYEISRFDDVPLTLSTFWPLANTFKFISTSTPAIDMSNWKIYVSGYGFEIKYPGSWYIKDITTDPTDDTKIADNIIMIDGNPILKNREASHLPSHGLIITTQTSFNPSSALCPPDKISSDTFVINNKSYFRCEMEFGIKSFYIPVVYGGKLYGFSYPAESTETGYINNILSTFKFIPSSTSLIDTSNRKTYTNSQDEYSIQYPPNWSVTKNGNFVDVYGPNADLGSINIRYYPSLNDLPLNPATNKPYGSFDQYVMDSHFFKDQKLISLNSGIAESATLVQDPSYKVMLIGGNGHFYEINYKTRYDQTISQLEQILSTFKFTK